MSPSLAAAWRACSESKYNNRLRSNVEERETSIERLPNRRLGACIIGCFVSLQRINGPWGPPPSEALPAGCRRTLLSLLWVRTAYTSILGVCYMTCSVCTSRCMTGGLSCVPSGKLYLKLGDALDAIAINYILPRLVTQVVWQIQIFPPCILWQHSELTWVHDRDALFDQIRLGLRISFHHAFYALCPCSISCRRFWFCFKLGVY